MKKAQAISINTIVVAAIALTVMILIILITTNNLTIFGKSSKNCESNGGICVETKDTCTEEPISGRVSLNRNCDYDDRPVWCVSPYVDRYP